MQVRDSLSKTLNADIYVILSNVGREVLDAENNLSVSGRSGSSTSGVYSSTGSVGSDSPEYNNLEQIPNMNTAQTVGNTEFVSTLTIGNTGDKK